MAGTVRFDVFVSYAHEDGPWATTLAENLHRLGLEVFLDRWELVAGELLAARLQEGLAKADVLVAVVSQSWVDSGWCNEEFAAALAASVAAQQRVIPVLLGEVNLPAFIASRLYVDFRTVASPGQYENLVEQLERAVRGLPTGRRPARGGPVVAPDGVLYSPDGPVQAGLRLDAQTVVFSTAGSEATHPPQGVDHGLERLVWELHRARVQAARGIVTRTGTRDGAPVAGSAMHAALLAVGKALGEGFLDGAAGAALRQEVEAVRARNVELRLGLRVDEPRWVDLPWETLTVPGLTEPLVLSDQVQLYRTVARQIAPVAIQVPGPLRILAVVASPERGGGELLDYERELARILDTVDPARADQGAYVRVLNWGSLAEIRAALEQERFHVLHLSCHAAPGFLVLEDERGQRDLVEAQRLLTEALPPGRGVPLVVLAGCSTAQTPAGPGEEDGEDTALAAAGRARAGLARDLLAGGVPAVLAMTDAVTDPYATELTAHLYAELARAEHPEPLAALSRARHLLERARRRLPSSDRHAMLAEWATPALFLAGPPLPLFDRSHGTAQVQAPPEPVLDPSMIVRQVGDFVGRRTELRHLLGALRAPLLAGVVIHGIGGVGKSTLAAELLHQLGADAGVVVPVSAATTLSVDQILEELRRRLTAHCLRTALPQDDPLHRLAIALSDARPPWRERWELVRQLLLGRAPVLLFVDNAEDLLAAAGDGFAVADGELADFLSAWVAAGPQARLLVTSRQPFILPGRAHRRLAVHHLGPLSQAEIRKLIWRLPGLDALTPAEQSRAYTDVGGHPRALEYLDALLRGGQARFPQVADRMEAALERRGIHRPQRWLAGVEGDLDRALAETVTLAVDDVLLDGLLDRVNQVSQARLLLDGLAVYRAPVDCTGAAWQLSALTRPPDPDPELVRRINDVHQQVNQARAAGAGPEDGFGLSPQTLARYRRDQADRARPPVALDEQAEDGLALLLTFGLVTPAPAPQDEAGSAPTGLVVHRWTADALTRRTDSEALIAAHRRAAAYWMWRVGVWPQDRAADITQLLEARSHYFEAGDIDQADACSQTVCSQLHTWGAWDWEQRLVEETLAWHPDHSHPRSAWLHQLGIIAQERGDYTTAERYYRDSLAIEEEVGNRAGLAGSYHQLGMIAQERGDYATAERYYRDALAIEEELGDRAGLASAYHQLGMIAQERGDYATAERYYRDSLAIKEELGDRAGLASAYHQLGMIAQERGDYATAER
ncbi:TIR domain-containing protein, partial [Streptacidiphilus sp. EB103A]|uniref:TIR domain-containing protein n=1 Tax=Streptacidiphilus sp. EB103A TaxID=3156275 RepID=UPI0035185EAC